MYMSNPFVLKIVRSGLSHISPDAAKFAEREIVREISAYISDLQHFKDVHIGLWATDKEPENKDLHFQIK
jgi:hypothetical protein